MTGNSFLDALTGRHRRPSVQTHPPMIIIGMHRSGTTVISECLELAGWFAGHKKDPNNEAVYFLALNNWLLAQAGCRWDLPEPFADLLAHAELSDKICDQVRHMMTVPSVEEFLGRKPRRDADGILEMKQCWGWKDPRNTITLPVWLKIFPDAKVVSVQRHGVDVAASLMQRSQAELNKWAQKLRLAPDAMVTDSARCLTLAGAFGLWKMYMQAAEANTALLGDRLFKIRYEDFLSSPEESLVSLLNFCGLKNDTASTVKKVSKLKPERAFAYRHDNALKEFAAAMSPDLRKYGYGE